MVWISLFDNYSISLDVVGMGKLWQKKMMWFQIFSIFYTQFALYALFFGGLGYLIVISMICGWFNLPTLMFMGNVWGMIGYLVANIVAADATISIFEMIEIKKLYENKM